MVGLTLTGCIPLAGLEVEPSDHASTSPSPSPSPTKAAESASSYTPPEPEHYGEGVYADPFKPGADPMTFTHFNGSGQTWQVEVVAVDSDATERVANETRGTSPPADGWQDVVVEIEATRLGVDDPGMAMWTAPTIIGADGNQYRELGNHLDPAIELMHDMFEGAVRTYRYTLQAPADVLDGALLSFEPLDSTERYYFELTDH